jgi:UDP-N-acetylmuramate dehydrogenase
MQNQTQALRGKLSHDAMLAKFTSWRIGGPAECLYQPADLDDLIIFLQHLPTEEPLTWLGLGSNTLIRDGGITGTVIVTQACLTGLKQLDEHTIRAEAGVACPAFARFAARLNLEGNEFLAGIPGTVGGALAMNAGCHGGETWDIVQAVEVINRRGEHFIRSPEEFQINYRSVIGRPDEWFVAGHFRLQQGVKETALERIRSLLAHRTATQPTSEPNCGSVFRNPPGDYAARLIESCGLKGKQIGDASISTKHANFIINHGAATASDIEALIELVKTEIKTTYGINLIREVHILGNNR